MKLTGIRALMCATVLMGMGFAVPTAAQQTEQPSIFIRYQYSLDEVIEMLKSNKGKPLAAASPAAKWLDEMGWRKVVKEFANKPFELSSQLEQNLRKQDAFLRDTFSYKVGDAVWVPAEAGEEPYGYRNARVNPRGLLTKIIQGELDTYFVVEVGVDNAAKGGIETVQGTYYDGKKGPVISYTDTFNIETKTYIYSMAEMERFNAPYRSQIVDQATEASVDYTKDTKWLNKLDSFKERVVAKGLEVDFTKSPELVYAAQKRLIMEMFNHFKMNRGGSMGGMLGDVAEGQGVCTTQACVLTHAAHAVGEPWGIKIMNISGQTVNPSGGHGFTRIMVRGIDETHVYDLVKDQSGNVKYRGMAIKSNAISFISDPGWADFGKTPDFFAMTPIEDAINPKPVNANRAVYELIQGRTFEEVVTKYGNKGPWEGNRTAFKNNLFGGAGRNEFLSPRAQLAQAAALEKSLGSELTKMVDEAKAFKTASSGSAANARALKSRIYAELVEGRAAKMAVPGMTADSLKILLTEYVFRAVR